MNITKKTYCTLLLFALSFAAPLSTNIEKNDEEKKPIDFDETIYSWSRTFAEALQITNQKHYKVSDPQECMINAINAFLTCLDPHSGFLDPKTYTAMLEMTSGEFFGIGIIIDNTRQQKDKFLLVVDTIPEGPADAKGIKPLDKIVEIEGKSLEGMSTEEAITKLKGEKGTTVTIKVMREGQPDIMTFELTRDVVKEQSSLCFYIPEQNVYYLSLNTFNQNSVNQLEQLLKKSLKNKFRGLILDLRNNSGGLLSSVIDICGLFLDKGSFVVSTKDKHGTVTDEYATRRKPIANITLPIFVLTNNYTASAAEILTGCLKLHSASLAQDKNKNLMVFQVGTTTFGKGSVQEVIPVSNNSGMKLTTSLYFLPEDTLIQGVGIEPDFIVEKTQPPTEQQLWFKKFYGQERALKYSIKPDDKDEKDNENDSDKNKSPDLKKKWSERAKEALEKDNQFRETLTLINLFQNARKYCPDQVKTRQDAVNYMKDIYAADDKLTLVEVKM